jgi:hypothetical protein
MKNKKFRMLNAENSRFIDAADSRVTPPDFTSKIAHYPHDFFCWRNASDLI